MIDLPAYPRTRHVMGSGLPSGASAREAVDIGAYRGRRIVVEEKLDGVHTFVGWDGAGDVHAGARNSLIDLARRDIRPERHLNRFKDWIDVHGARLLERFEDRYLPLGEWCQAAHTAYYDALPHWWFEFDVYDRSIGAFLGTDERRALIGDLPVVSVPVLYDGPAISLDHLMSIVSVPGEDGQAPGLRWTEASLYKTAGWRESLDAAIRHEGLDPALNAHRFEESRAAEGLYVKVEEDGRVVERLKLVRPDFVHSILKAEGHWRDKPVVPNGLVDGVNILAPDLGWISPILNFTP